MESTSPFYTSCRNKQEDACSIQARAILPCHSILILLSLVHEPLKSGATGRHVSEAPMWGFSADFWLLPSCFEAGHQPFRVILV